MKGIAKVFTFIILASLVLAACGTAASTQAPEKTEAPTQASALPDLGGKAITVAVENAYPPFNSIDETSGKGVGWDYDAVNEICKRLNCKPEFKEAAWDGIFQGIGGGFGGCVLRGCGLGSRRRILTSIPLCFRIACVWS